MKISWNFARFIPKLLSQNFTKFKDMRPKFMKSSNYFHFRPAAQYANICWSVSNLRKNMNCYFHFIAGIFPKITEVTGESNDDLSIGNPVVAAPLVSVTKERPRVKTTRRPQTRFKKLKMVLHKIDFRLKKIPNNVFK